MPEIRILSDADAAADAAAEIFTDAAENALSEGRRFKVALSGGSTPGKLYSRLVSAPIEWANVDLYFGDERNVPADDPQSNFRMVREILFDLLAIPDHQIHRWRTELGDPEATAAEYRDRLAELGSPPRFDLVLLGLGDDAHTASLFPNTDAVDKREISAISNWVPAIDATRFTITFPVINAASLVLFLVSGESKARAMQRVFDGSESVRDVPAIGVSPNAGRAIWIVDEDAVKYAARG